MIISGCIIALFLTVLLLLKKGRATADNILASWLFVIAVHLLCAHLATRTSGPALLFTGVDIPLPLVHGPMFFLYVAALTGSLPGTSKWPMLHFLPAIACYAYLIPFFVLPETQKRYIMMHNGAGYENFVVIKSIAVILSGIAYIALSLPKIIACSRNLQHTHSYMEKISLNWLKYLTYALAAVWITVMFGTDMLVNIAVAVFVITLGFFGIRQTSVFSGNRSIMEFTTPETITNQPSRKYENSGLSEGKRRHMEAALQQVMVTDKPYLLPDLSLDKLAAMLDTHPNYLSQYINEELEMTFYDYINTKRIDEFKRIIQLPENRNLNLLGICYECGFNSKSSFNRNFKKITGSTPSEYLQSLQKT